MAILPGESTSILVASDDGLIVLGENDGELFRFDQLGKSTYLKTVATGSLRAGTKSVAYAGRDAKHLFIAAVSKQGSITSPIPFELAGTPRQLSFSQAGDSGKAALFVLHDRGLSVIRSGTEADYQTTEVPVPSFPSAFRVADLNQDGTPDLVVADADNRLTFFSGHISGVFEQVGGTDTLSNPHRLDVIDTNRDGRPDIVVLGDRGLEIHLQRSGGGFRRAEFVYSDPHLSDLATADVNGDGVPDVATVDRSRGCVTFFYGSGAGTFERGSSYLVGRSPTRVILEDVDGDGLTDVISLNSLDGTVTVLPGLRGGGFGGTPAILVESEELTAIAVADFNLDAVLDIAISSETEGNIHVFLGERLGGFSARAPRAVGRQPRALIGGDFDSDGLPDLAIANFGNDEVAILAGDGRGGFSAPTLIPVGLGPNAIASGQFGATERLDVAVANLLSDSVSILYQNARGRFDNAVNFPVVPRPTFLLVGDLNGDRHSDLAVGGRDNDEVAILHGGDGQLQEPEITQLAGAANPTVAADFDDDGQIDLVDIDQVGNVIRVVPGIGIGSFGPALEIPIGRSTQALVSGDFDGDGKPDLALVHRAARLVTLLLNRSGATNTDP